MTTTGFSDAQDDRIKGKQLSTQGKGMQRFSMQGMNLGPHVQMDRMQSRYSIYHIHICFQIMDTNTNTNIDR